MTNSPIDLLLALFPRSTPAFHLCTQCETPHNSLYFYPNLDHAWLCERCNRLLMQRQKDTPNLPLFLLRRNAVKRLGDSGFLERWLVRLENELPLPDDHLLDIARLLGLDWWADATPSAVFRNHPSFRQSGHWLLISQICGLNV